MICDQLTDFPIDSLSIFLMKNTFKYLTCDIRIFLEPSDRILIPSLAERNINSHPVTFFSSAVPQIFSHAEKHLKFIFVCLKTHFLYHIHGFFDKIFIVCSYAAICFSFKCNAQNFQKIFLISSASLNAISSGST